MSKYVSVQNLCKAHPCLSEDLVRKHLADAAINGLDDIGAVGIMAHHYGIPHWASDRDVATRDMVDEEKYFDWMYGQARLLRE